MYTRERDSAADFCFFFLFCLLNFRHPRENFLGPFSSQQDVKNEFYSTVSHDWIGDGDGIGRPVRRVRRRARTTFRKLLLLFLP